MRCNHCGKEVSSGHFTITRGFVCYSCSAGLGVSLCPECGNRYPRSDLVIHKGRLYCRSDHRIQVMRSEKKDALAKAEAKKKNAMRKKTSIKARVRERKISARDLGLLGKYDSFKKKFGPKSRPKSRSKPVKLGYKDKVKLEIREILRQELSKGLSLGKKKKRGNFSDILSQLRDKTRGKSSK